ncbi:hypothetical protein HDF13_001822 [Edaphobacter lichenicola]|uniref:Uncharacterized protein n=1 Tax=Tunturiibacter gelidiferens TaxID=3069689 RepID=A0ACC5NYJ8_9BACT|nr:hypothetical protein [Edaphobacter lichenicola]
MSRGRGLQQLVASLVGAMLSFCVVAVPIYCKIADVRVNGFFHGGPVALAAAMAGLFGGGIVAVMVLVFLLRWASGREQRELEPRAAPTLELFGKAGIVTKKRLEVREERHRRSGGS